jgi:hypothetical protein
MKTIKDILILTGLVIILGIVFLWLMPQRCTKENITSSDTVYIYSDTIKLFLTEKEIVPVKEIAVKTIPVYYYITDTIYNAQTIDTLKIIAEFFTEKTYNQILLNDTTGYIRLYQVISMNSIKEQELTYLPPPQLLITNTNTINSLHKFRFGVGGEYVLSNQNDLYLKGAVLIKEKYLISAGLSLNKGKSIGVIYMF